MRQKKDTEVEIRPWIHIYHRSIFNCLGKSGHHSFNSFCLHNPEYFTFIKLMSLEVSCFPSWKEVRSAHHLLLQWLCPAFATALTERSLFIIKILDLCGKVEAKNVKVAKNNELMSFISSVLDYVVFIYPFANSILHSYCAGPMLERTYRSLSEDVCLFQVDFSSTNRMSKWI